MIQSIKSEVINLVNEVIRKYHLNPVKQRNINYNSILYICIISVICNMLQLKIPEIEINQTVRIIIESYGYENSFGPVFEYHKKNTFSILKPEDYTTIDQKEQEQITLNIHRSQKELQKNKIEMKQPLNICLLRHITMKLVIYQVNSLKVLGFYYQLVIRQYMEEIQIQSQFELKILPYI
ncbi:unnamed protein product (macronuclear) [Paramecium tetraurelia]|uniref:Uncharacterized protein n=1 Tax=Paramecium tetraurelia TaxID=5888 RepID=A0DGZ1_PARTE|nr:uncharacterized protein GSPATT00002437001 [Paramecium tetraurelia]CAK82308.1 unnamed protein product [Paramecium tetraurelia]|eukprot:XP_001449705.1 hypothetical protein (macronuclear) [Paramecium tetraurelia strain d4-2]